MERAWVYLIFDTGDGVIEILEAICWHLSLHVERALRQAQQFSNWGSNIFLQCFLVIQLKITVCFRGPLIIQGT